MDYCSIKQTSSSRHILVQIFLLCLLNLLSIPALHANTNETQAIVALDDAQLEHQRQLFLRAEAAFNKRQMRTYRKLAEQLQAYPLYPYLKYREILRNLTKQDTQQLKSFLNRYSDSPITLKLRQKILNHLASKRRWNEYLQYYVPQDKERLQCQYLRALIEQGHPEAAFMQVPDLWLVGNSQHKSCDRVFEAYIKAGRLTDDQIWQRLSLVMQKGRIQLAEYLAKSLSTNDRRWVKLWVNIHRHPKKLLKAELLNQVHPMKYGIMAHGIKRLARKQPEQAIELWQQLKSRYGFPQEDEYQVYKAIGLSLAYKHEGDAEHWLARIPSEHLDLKAQQWRIQNAIRMKNWSVVRDVIEDLPLSEQREKRWQFWWAFANQEMGNTLESEEIFKRLAVKRHYYGFIAADLLNQPYHFENRPVDVDEQMVSEISQLPAFIRAREFYQLNRIADARREWNQALNDLQDEQLLASAKLAYHWGWYDRAIATIGKTDHRDDIEMRFPLAFNDLIHDYSNRYQVDPAWTYAIIRRESIFISDAKSHAGALGLMQLLPRTAKAVARSIKTRYRGRRQLINSDANIKLGTRYLYQMFKHHDNQTVLATAAYNAGMRRVKSWLPEDEPMDAIRWIESIPYTETREYVTNVLAYKIIYEYRMGQEQSRLSNLMPPVPARI